VSVRVVCGWRVDRARHVALGNETQEAYARFLYGVQAELFRSATRSELAVLALAAGAVP
jgi:hypothetical protein